MFDVALKSIKALFDVDDAYGGFEFIPLDERILSPPPQRDPTPNWQGQVPFHLWLPWRDPPPASATRRLVQFEMAEYFQIRDETKHVFVGFVFSAF